METKTPVYILSTALAVSLGANVFLVGTVPEVQAGPKKECHVTDTPLTATQKTCLEGCLDGVVCPAADAALGLAGANACKTNKHAKTFFLNWQRGNVDKNDQPLPDTATLSGTTCHAGTWTPGSPQ